MQERIIACWQMAWKRLGNMSVDNLLYEPVVIIDETSLFKYTKRKNGKKRIEGN